MVNTEISTGFRPITPISIISKSSKTHIYKTLSNFLIFSTRSLCGFDLRDIAKLVLWFELIENHATFRLQIAVINYHYCRESTLQEIRPCLPCRPLQTFQTYVRCKYYCKDVNNRTDSDVNIRIDRYEKIRTLRFAFCN